MQSIYIQIASDGTVGEAVTLGGDGKIDMSDFVRMKRYLVDSTVALGK